ncbi:MAG: adenylate/guanylate cyclase domain-containing protein [Bacteroidetes bacterium]|nr:adenylate/guanylate cyclase domain-containing protein [Bacteroidota bacterium]
MRMLTTNDMRAVANITLAYLLINWFITFYNEAIWGASFSLGPIPENNVWVNLGVNTLTGLMAGVFGGSLFVWLHRTVFRRNSFQLAMTYTVLTYIIIFLFVSLITSSFFLYFETGPAISGPAFLSLAVVRVFTPLSLVYFLLWLVISFFTMFMLQINDKFGPGVLWKFLMGQYHQPRQEERIFLFLDMKSSTAIAEKIGNEQYFRLLHDVFSDMAESIADYRGEIYQYVGDEVVISWPLKQGLMNHNCLRYFAHIREKLASLAPYYEVKYGIVPTFKGGLHHGSVTAGELGSIKRDIVYSGDVLNTTARIQELCNQFGVDFLVSVPTLSLLGAHPSFEPKFLGNLTLRGREETIDVSTVTWHTAPVLAS